MTTPVRDRTVMIAIMLLAAYAGSAGATDGAPDSTAADAPRMHTVVAGEHYRAGSVHRFLLGDDYRKLWTTPIEVPELDMRAFAGGLRPVRRVGGQQTHGLAMEGADGRAYTFRGLDKDPTEILPPELHGTFVDRLFQDQIASSFPGGMVAVAPLMQAAGVLHTEPMLVVLPDDSLLGEFRPDFAGLLGTFEEYPRAGSDGSSGCFGATEIINGAEMWKRMDEDPSTRPDSRAFLTARLVDLLIGDWDRHRGQWRWAKLPGDEQWQPIPEDRDQAFVRFEGLVVSAGRMQLPQFVSFEKKYPGIDGLTWNGRDGDRRILVDLEKPVWDEVARDLQARITDAVIADAVARIPAAYRAIEGADLEATLQSRRDQLTEVTDRFYRFLARDVDIHATNQDESIMVMRTEGDDVEVAVALKRSMDAPYLRRVFHADDTDEVRLYLGGGADSVVTKGGKGRITVRVIGGEGEDFIDDTAGMGLHVSDSDAAARVLRGSGTKLDSRPYTPPVREKAPWIPPRDWGRRYIYFPWIGGNTDLGVLFVAGLQSEGYGFRKDPYADKQTVRVGYATNAGGFGGDYRGEFRRENSRASTGLYVRASGLDFLHYYGYGNETQAPRDEDFYKVKQSMYLIEPSLSLPVGRLWTATLRASATFAKNKNEPNHFITEEDPYGNEDFFEFGAGAGLSLDTRDSQVAAMSGVRITIDGTVYPQVGDVVSTFGDVRGEVAFLQPIAILSTPTLALRAGGEKVWGTYPYFEAAYIGGVRTLRGFPSQRFAGDASLYGSAELRIPLTDLYIFVPGRLGIFALGDTGRVYLEGESSDKWHVGAGGGVWFSFLNPANTASLAVAASDEGTGVYIVAGLSF
jgi:Omp85 superfamily domain